MAFFQHIPDDASLDEVLMRLRLFAGIERSEEQISRGEFYTADEVRAHVDEWLRSRGVI
jgi:hypothetical protein